MVVAAVGGPPGSPPGEGPTEQGRKQAVQNDPRLPGLVQGLRPKGSRGPVLRAFPPVCISFPFLPPSFLFSPSYPFLTENLSMSPSQLPSMDGRHGRNSPFSLAGVWADDGHSGQGKGTPANEEHTRLVKGAPGRGGILWEGEACSGQGRDAPGR